MFKKVMMALACTIVAVSVMAAPKVYVQQSSKQEVFETMFRAIIEEDKDALWAIIDPELRELIIKDSGSEAKGKNDVWNGFIKNWNRGQNIMLRNMLNDPVQRDTLLKKAVEQQGHTLVRRENKWYINPMKK